MVLEEIKINRNDFKYEQEVTEEAIWENPFLVP